MQHLVFSTSPKSFSVLFLSILRRMTYEQYPKFEHKPGVIHCVYRPLTYFVNNMMVIILS